MEIISRREAAQRGLIRYFTGEPCKRGHVAERIVSNCVCMECGSLRMRTWRANNGDIARQIARSWRLANPRKQREYDRRKRERDPEGRAALLAKLAAHPAYDKAGSLNRRTRKSNGDRVTGAELETVKARAKGRCANCGARRKLEFDHIGPLARGGRHDVKNLQMLCHACNMEKRARDPIEWAQDNGRLI